MTCKQRRRPGRHRCPLRRHSIDDRKRVSRDSPSPSKRIWHLGGLTRPPSPPRAAGLRKGGPTFRRLANRSRPRISGSRLLRFATALHDVGLAADDLPLMGGKSRFGCAPWLLLGSHRFAFALAAHSVRRSHRHLHYAPLTPAATSETCHRHVFLTLKARD